MDIGNTIRKYRQAKNLSVRELSRLTGFSASAISQIENGKSIPNVLTIKEIAEALEVSIVSFLMDNDPDSISLVRKGEQQKLIRNQTATGELVEHILIKKKDFKMGPALISVPPKSDSGESLHHAGEEMVYMLSGELIYELEGMETYHLYEGDTLYYPATVPHKWINPSEEATAELLMISTPSFI